MEKIKDTRVGDWLKNKAPGILDVAGDLLPDAGVLGVVKRLVNSDPDLSPEDKLEYEKVQGELEATRQKEVTKRWEADMSSDVHLAKVIRPAVMIALLIFFMSITLWDAISENFMPRDSFIDLLQVLMLTVFGAYFAGRTIEKTKKG